MDLDGIIIIDKDEGLTSFEVVRKVKSRLKAKKAGHAGTLDKAASGILIMCINRATVVQSILMNHFKRYRATILLGIETDTLDRYGKVVKTAKVNRYSNDKINRVLKGFTGKIKQRPPAFSAIHQNGERLYKRALKGEKLDPKPRDIEIRELVLLENKENKITIEVFASKGTYIRSLARDIAFSLGTCGHLAQLRRLEVGPFSVQGAVKMDEVSDYTCLIPLNEALNYIPLIEVTGEEALMVQNGVPPEKIFLEKKLLSLEERYFRLVFHAKLIAIIEKGHTLRYYKVFKDLEVVHY